MDLRKAAFLLVGSLVFLSGATAQEGYVLKLGEGERLGPNRLIKASPESGTQGGVVVFDRLDPGFETTFHIHTTADEFFYVISGSGAAEFGGDKIEIGEGDFIFVSAGTQHNLSVSDDGPMELLFVLDRPGADGWFREAHERFFSQGIPLTVEDCNEMGEKYDYVCVD